MFPNYERLFCACVRACVCTNQPEFNIYATIGIIDLYGMTMTQACHILTNAAVNASRWLTYMLFPTNFVQKRSVCSHVESKLICNKVVDKKQ